MRKIIADLAVSLDGFIEGPNGETDWCILDDDMDMEAFIDTVDTIFYGRISYDAWGNFEPEATASPAEKQLWHNVHSRKKYVFSKQAGAGDGKATFIHTDIKTAVAAIRQQEGKDIWLYGGAGLIRSFMNADLIDVYRLSVHPLVLGGGIPLFRDLQQRINLQLLHSHVFRSGVVQLVYKPVR